MFFEQVISQDGTKQDENGNTIPKYPRHDLYVRLNNQIRHIPNEKVEVTGHFLRKGFNCPSHLLQICPWFYLKVAMLMQVFDAQWFDAGYISTVNRTRRPTKPMICSNISQQLLI
jgi:hypothetical protein